MLSKRLAAAAPQDHRRILEYKIFTYQGLIARAETEIEWGLRGLELIDSLSNTPPDDQPIHTLSSA
jgi:PadR family transcriptional regulator AphA